MSSILCLVEAKIKEFHRKLQVQIKMRLAYNKLMIIIIIILLIILAFFVTYRYYLKPKRQLRRYLNVFRSLGYTVYQMPFAFLGLSIVNKFQRGLKHHKDAMYEERTIYPHIDVAIGNVLDKVIVEFVNPQLIKTFLNGTVLYNYPKFQLMIKGQKAIFGDGLIFSQGDDWKHKRKLLSKTFNFDLVKANIPKIGHIFDRSLEMFEQAHKVGQNTFKFSLLGLAARIFNNVMMECFFGADHSKETIKGKPFEQFVNDTVIHVSALTLNPLIALFGKLAWKSGLLPEIRKAKQGVDLIRKKSAEIIREITERVKSQPKRERCTFLIESLIHEMLQNKGQASLTDQQLVDEFQTFLIAGTDTTARFLTMMVYYLANNPSKLNRLRKEINEVIKSDEDITYENLKKLNYLDWVQFETTRMFGPGNGVFPRIAQEDDFINDVPLAKGTVVTIQPRGNHYNPKYFKDPDEFRPERWESECDGIHPYAFIGFGSGVRSCIGKQLSYMESKIVLIKLLQRYDTIEAPKQVTLKVSFVYESEPFDVTFTKRASAQ